MKANLCTPCREQLAKFVTVRGITLKAKTVAPVGAREKDQKITCLACGRRKFGGTYEFDGRLYRSFHRKRKLSTD